MASIWLALVLMCANPEQLVLPQGVADNRRGFGKHPSWIVGLVTQRLNPKLLCFRLLAAWLKFDYGNEDY
jgi:hypothetical protein